MDLSCWNNAVAVGSEDGDIIILDTITGSQTAVLSGHTAEVRCLTFSSDGKSLVSGSCDRTVKLWDVQTGGVIKTFHGHTHLVWSVSISADSTRIASTSGDKTICLWDIQTGECYYTIKQQDYVVHVSFSPMDPQHLISISGNKVRQWNTNGHQGGPTYDGSHVAFSSDGTQFASCNVPTVTVCNSSSGEIVAEFNVANRHPLYCQHCCFSPDGRLIAIAADYIAYVWDITSSEPYLVETFTGHTGSIRSLAFSSPSTLISASSDKSVRFWQIGALDQPMANPKSTSLTSATINSVTLQAKDGVTITSDSDGVVRTWDISTGLCKESFQTPARDFSMGDAQMINDKLIFIWYADGMINIWDVEKGELLLKADKLSRPKGLKISGDGSRLFLLDAWSIQAWSVQTGEIVGKVELTDSTGHYVSLAVDGSRVSVHCIHSSRLNPQINSYQGWDFGMPCSSPVQLPNMSMLHLNDTLLWDNDLSSIKDKATGKVVCQLPRRFIWSQYVQWNGHYFAASFKDYREILILDFSHVPFQ